MDRVLISICLLLPLLFSVGHAALTFHDVWNLVLPHSHSTEHAVPDQIHHGEAKTTPLATPGDAGDAGAGAGDVSDHVKYRVDFGNKVWPNVYYSRSDRCGDVVWGTRSWPYIYFDKTEDRGDLPAKSHVAVAAAADSEPAAVNYGRKGGKVVRLY